MTQLKQPNLSIQGAAGWCLSVAQNVWGVPHIYNYALEAWNASSQFNHPNEQPPSDVCVVVYWTYFDVKDQMPYGHIATWVPGKGVYTSPFNTSYGSEWYPSIQAMTNRINQIRGANSSYLGWSESLSNVKLVTGGSMAETVTRDVDVILQHGILGRNGLRGRSYSLDGSTGAVWEGQPLTNNLIQNIGFLSDEARQWRDSGDSNSVNGINAQLDSIPSKDATIASEQAKNADLTNQLALANGQVVELTSQIAIKDQQIKDLEKENADLKAQVAAGGGDITVNFNFMQIFLWNVIKMFGTKGA